jgi:hypothetical protein
MLTVKRRHQRIMPAAGGSYPPILSTEGPGARSASLKEWGRVKEVVGSTSRLRAVGPVWGARVAPGAGVEAGRRPRPVGLGLDAGEERRRLEFRPGPSAALECGWGGWVAPWSSRTERGQRLGCRGIPWPTCGEHGALRPRPDGLQAVRRPRRRCGGHADHGLASGRVRVSRRLGLGEAADLAVAQAVVDEREDLAGHRHPRLVRAAPFGDTPKPRSQAGSAVIAGHRLDQRPAHQLRALFGDRTAGRLGVGLAMLGGQARPRAQRLGGAEPGDVADLGHQGASRRPAVASRA